MTSFKAACIQMRTSRSIEDNIDQASASIRQAAQEGATYIQTPEMTHLLERNRRSLSEKIRIQEEDAGVRAFGALAAELKVWLHIGSLAIDRGDGKVANRAFLFDPEGKLTSTYDKIHMFDVDLANGESWRESNTYEPGSQSPVIAIDEAKLGIAICYDIRFANLFHQQAQAGADILTAPACFTKQTGEAHWHVLLRARAIENGAFMIAAAQGGDHEDGRQTFGHSLIIDPWGKIIGEADHNQPGFIVADIDLSVVSTARRRIPSLTHVRDFDTLTL